MTNSKDSLRFRYKGDNFSSDKSDEILVGASYSVENDKSYFYHENNSVSFSPSNEISYDNSTMAELFNPTKLYENLIKSLMIIVAVIASVFFLKEIAGSASVFSYSIEKSTMLFIGVYFSMFAGGVFFFTRKKRIKLQLRDGFLIINSFPSLNQRIPLSKILLCKVNVLKESAGGGLQIPLRESGSYSFDLNSGVIVTLVNGKSLFIGSSNS